MSLKISRIALPTSLTRYSSARILILAKGPPSSNAIVPSWNTHVARSHRDRALTPSLFVSFVLSKFIYRYTYMQQSNTMMCRSFSGHWFRYIYLWFMLPESTVACMNQFLIPFYKQGAKLRIGQKRISCWSSNELAKIM